MIRERLNYYQKEIKQWLSLLISYIISLIIKKSKKDGPIQNPIIKLYTRTYDNANEAVHNKFFISLRPIWMEILEMLYSFYKDQL